MQPDSTTGDEEDDDQGHISHGVFPVVTDSMKCSVKAVD
jgi:hypothetical protein